MYHRHVGALVFLLSWTQSAHAFVLTPRPSARVSFTSPVLRAELAGADFDRPAKASADGVVDANTYNVNLEKAAELWTAQTQVEKSAIRAPGVPFLASKSKDYFVDDVSFLVSRDGGLGLELLELAGGRSDGYGITIVENVVGNAAKAGILAGDSIASVAVPPPDFTFDSDLVASDVKDCEARDFDATIDVLTSFDPEVKELLVTVKRVRRWPKISLKVEYPPSQCAEGVDNVKYVELFAGENLQRALLNRGIVLDDPGQRKCDFCGHSYCYVRVMNGRKLLNPMSMTEEKLMAERPRDRLSCKTTVGYNMQEGDVSIRVNLSQWRKGE
mmetsp:Transcript_14216/g.29034  ORF Transcript_14216/g.29034 Transcript_14216/m.29034 type:complete len:329 (+) Transcript_14216:148-1134(+)